MIENVRKATKQLKAAKRNVEQMQNLDLVERLSICFFLDSLVSWLVYGKGYRGTTLAQEAHRLAKALDSIQDPNTRRMQ